MFLVLTFISVLASAVGALAMVYALRAVRRALCVPTEEPRTCREFLAGITYDMEPIPAGWTRVHTEWFCRHGYAAGEAHDSEGNVFSQPL
jgi:hypothetical protein